MSQLQTNFSRLELIQESWERGDLYYKVRPYQRILYESLWAAINNKACLKYVLKCSRRFGKSTILCLIALEFANRKPNSQIRFAAPTGKALKKITTPILKMLVSDCPPNLKPEYKVQEQLWVFPNGSEIHMAGTDNGNAESLRGTASDLNLLDEAGFASDLDYVLQDILMPQTLTTGGKTLLASTPPRTPAHDFTEIARECEVSGFLTKLTIHDNSSIDESTKERYCKEAGGPTATTWRREYLCEDVIDEDLAIIPEWKDDFIRKTPKDQHYGYYHKYVGMDLGRVDNTELVFGTYLFKPAILYIEDELCMSGASWTTVTLKDAIFKKEASLWPDQKVYRRISDNNNPHLIQDLSSLHNCYFIETDKESLEAMVNEVRMLVGEGRLIVHPRCIRTIGCLKYGIWDDRRKMFERSKAFGHFDALAALIYLVRNLSKHSNPIPVTHGHENHRSWLGNVKDQMSSTTNARAINNALTPKRKVI